jgi:hypothetical protein
MLHSVLIRTLREGVTIEDFIDAWRPDPTEDEQMRFRVVHARALDDPQKVISIGFHDVGAEEFMEFAASEAFATTNEVRHTRIAPLIEEADSGFTGVFEVVADEEIAL